MMCLFVLKPDGRKRNITVLHENPSFDRALALHYKHPNHVSKPICALNPDSGELEWLNPTYSREQAIAFMAETLEL